MFCFLAGLALAASVACVGIDTTTGAPCTLDRHDPYSFCIDPSWTRPSDLFENDTYRFSAVWPRIYLGNILPSLDFDDLRWDAATCEANGEWPYFDIDKIVPPLDFNELTRLRKHAMPPFE
jgi:hypothetical protein